MVAYSIVFELSQKWYVGILIPDCSAQSIEAAIRLFYTKLPKGAIKTVITDCDKEFSCYNLLEKDLNIQVYFVDQIPIFSSNVAVAKMEMAYYGVLSKENGF